MNEQPITAAPLGRFIVRRDVPSFVASRFGLTLTRHTLDSLAKRGGGPAYHRWQGKAAYEVEPLVAWVAEQLGPARRSASDPSSDERTQH